LPEEEEMDFDPLHKEFWEFIKAFASWLSARLKSAGLNFESSKDFAVDILLAKRGANTPAFVHASVIVMAVGVLVSGGLLSSTSVISGSYPGVPANPLIAASGEVLSEQNVISSTITPVTIISEKPRDKTLDYEVKDGDTISSIAAEFGVSEETILWENDISKNSTLKAGQNLKILPVSGVAHTVVSGDTIYSVAKKYQANAQAILNFPFNDVGEDFQLASGTVLVVPEGAPPAAPKPAPTQYLAKENIPVATDLGSGQFMWPANGGISQYFSWYHPAVDISNLGGGPIRASDSGTVTVAGWLDNYGYGNRVIVDHGNGYTTQYSHLSAIYVSPGQKVGKGEVLGAMGSTGRSTGVHLDFIIRKGGTALNPLSILSK